MSSKGVASEVSMAGEGGVTNDEGKGLDVVVIGHILNESVIFPDHELYPVLGSPAAYSSICLASLGRRVGLVTKVGADFPRNLLSVFDELGVKQDGIGRSRTSSKNELIYHADGRKTIKFLSRADSITFTDIPADYLDAQIIYVCPMDGEVDIDTFERLQQRRCRIVVDLGGFGGATSAVHPAIKDGRQLAAVCPLCEVVKASTEDVEYILGIPGRDYEAAAKALLGWGAGAAIITRGRDGAYVSIADKSAVFPAYLEDPQKVVDQTGAGDCFSAGFLSEYVESRDPFLAALYGNAATSFVIERTGGASAARMPKKADADARARELRARSPVGHRAM